MDTGIGFGGAIYGQGTHGKGVMQSYGMVASNSSVAGTFGIVQWESTNALINSTGVLKPFGGLIKGGTTYSEAITSMQSYPNFIWAGFTTTSEQSTVYISGYIAWDGQLITDATWTTQIID